MTCPTSFAAHPYAMTNLSLSNFKTILCIGCHADDIEIGCGGAIQRLVQEIPQVKVHWVVLGAEGARAEEARRSAEVFLDGVDDREIEIRAFRDSYFPTQYEALKDFFHELAARVAPDMIFTHRPEDAHQDHRVAAELTWTAFRNQTIFEYEIPKYEGDLGRPNLYFPLDQATADRKMNLIVEHFATQREKTWFQRDVFESLMRVRGIECKSPSGLAEAFHVSKAVI